MFKFLYKNLRLLNFLIIPLYFSGCMTLFNGKKMDQGIWFDSNVPGTLVICEGGKKVKTPGKLLLRGGVSHNCMAKAEGYTTQKFQIKSSRTGGGLLLSAETNFLAWGWYTFGLGLIAGCIIDIATGNTRSLVVRDNNVIIGMPVDPNAPKKLPATTLKNKVPAEVKVPRKTMPSTLGSKPSVKSVKMNHSSAPPVTVPEPRPI
jgi:hypothetical protein